MDFEISKKDFSSALRQILQGRKPDSDDLVDMTAQNDTLTVVVTARSIEVPIQVHESGSFGIPIRFLTRIKKIAVTYDESRLRIRVSNGKFRIQGMSLGDPGIMAKAIARRIIDLPEGALPRDYLCLPLIFSPDEIADCGFSAKVLEAQRKMAEDMHLACEVLSRYGFEHAELHAMAKQKIKAHADATKCALLGSA